MRVLYVEERPRVKQRKNLLMASVIFAMTMPFISFAAEPAQAGTDADAVMEVGRVYTPSTDDKETATAPAATTPTPAVTATITPAASVTVTPTPAPVVTVQSTPAAAPTADAAPDVTTAAADTAAPAAQPTAPVPGAADWLEPAVGEWYTTDGELAMTITDSAINNCPVTALTDMTLDYPRTGRFTVAEAAGEKTIKLDLLGHKSHQYLIVNDRTPLRRSIHGDHYETIGNLYLGMTKADLVAAYGQPATVTPDQGTERWAYSTPHVDVVLQGNLVMAVRVYKDCDLTFAQSGLGANDTPDAYAQAYGLEAVPTVPTEPGVSSPAYNLPQGERLHFGQNFVELSVF